MTDTDDVALLELQVAVFSILHLRFIHLRFRGSFLRVHTMAVNSLHRSVITLIVVLRKSKT